MVHFDREEVWIKSMKTKVSIVWFEIELFAVYLLPSICRPPDLGAWCLQFQLLPSLSRTMYFWLSFELDWEMHEETINLPTYFTYLHVDILTLTFDLLIYK